MLYFKFVCSEDKMMKTREIVESNKNKVQRYREVKILLQIIPILYFVLCCSIGAI